MRCKVVICGVDDSLPVPSCVHGRCQLFERSNGKNADKNGVKFYACSVYRDRKLCNAYFIAEEYGKKPRIRDKSLVVADSVIGKRPIEVETTLDHKRFKAITDDNGNSQFFFDDPTVCYVSGQVESLLVNASDKILCIGCPSIAMNLTSVKSTLLDMDDRLKDQFSGDFYHYSMFNSVIKGEDLFVRGLQDVSLIKAIIIDPPFQPVLLDGLRESLKCLLGEARFDEIPLFLCFPKFFNTRVKEVFPGIEILENSTLTYKNHKKFHKPEKSPVRLFARNI
jgi:Probable N6-adenine methyltransferase